MNTKYIPKEILNNPKFDIKYFNEEAYQFFIEINQNVNKDKENDKDYIQLLIDINDRIDAEYEARKSKEISERKRVELLEAKEELQYLLNLKN